MNPVEDRFRHRVADAVPKVRRQSDITWLVPDRRSGSPPSRYVGLFRGIEHFQRGPDGTIRSARGPISFELEFPDDYCAPGDPTLMLRVARVQTRVLHPNVSPTGIVCLGPRFRPATRLLPLLEHVYRLLASRLWAADSPLDPVAAEFYRRHGDRVRGLRAEPLWREPAASRVRVTDLAGASAPAAAPEETS